MAIVTATLTFDLSPENILMERVWQKIIIDGTINERIQSLILIEPGFGLNLVSVEDAEITAHNVEG
jgi:hypothetical protein